MSENHEETNDLIDISTKDHLRNDLNATDDELKYLEKLLKIQKEKMTKHQVNRNEPSVVIDNFLYHGDLAHAIDVNLLLDLHIRHIINICDCPLDKEIYEIFDVLWIKDMEDHFQGNIRKHFDETNEFLLKCKQNNDKVLVHCQAGISRSSSIVLAYLISIDKQSLEKAYEHLLERRSIAAPNYGFLIELIRYENEIQQKTQLNTTDDKQKPVKSIDDNSVDKTKL
ncbi:unnamed protein product [Rotaria sp. Silwood2]|nr:unnamed protein product [Rotaria sp. Silwood2]CAF3089410.1 unnamed protein product [Rotaria sp. Silwood2]CAF3295758.1 unnamed protein product [Rotaria sp. Silwood2]CAF3373253.1 unnamed protein product [Rotaria sp. Silwood2]CAF4036373.1 unnamed protein product [Rotaria sp. Silwood2]